MACVILVEVMTDEGINTCAAHRAAALLLNQDDGNQHMNYCLERDLVESPDPSAPRREIRLAQRSRPRVSAEPRRSRPGPRAARAERKPMTADTSPHLDFSGRVGLVTGGRQRDRLGHRPAARPAGLPAGDRGSKRRGRQHRRRAAHRCGKRGDLHQGRRTRTRRRRAHGRRDANALWKAGHTGAQRRRRYRAQLPGDLARRMAPPDRHRSFRHLLLCPGGCSRHGRGRLWPDREPGLHGRPARRHRAGRLWCGQGRRHRPDKSHGSGAGALRITANALAPGAIETALVARMHSEETRHVYRAGIPLDRYGTPNETAAAAVFLASEQARYVTGQILGVDGGFLAAA